MYPPLDPTPVPRHGQSRPIHAGIPDGAYVYVQDQSGVIWVLRDGAHRHPKVLGNGLPAQYAGDLTIVSRTIKDLTNLSGTFQCDDPAGLLVVADELEHQGLIVSPGAVRFFPQDGSKPRILR
jgi:hypothetical protein